MKRMKIDVPRPIIVKQYNEKMGGVDLCDRILPNDVPIQQTN